MHFGAISSTTERDVEKILDRNLDFTTWLYHEACRVGARFQYASSASVYGLTDHFREDGPVDPRSAYAWSKYLVERYIRDHPCDDIHAQGFRYFNVYGPGEGHKSQPSPYQVFHDQAETTGVITLYVGEQEAHRDFVPVSRILEIHERFLTISESGVWNIGSGRTQTFREIADLVSRQTGARIVELPLPAELERQYQWYTCANLDHLNSTLERYS
jgi:ADP-L-glycero-D-manno-heptose 6-epimerase